MKDKILGILSDELPLIDPDDCKDTVNRIDKLIKESQLDNDFVNIPTMNNYKIIEKQKEIMNFYAKIINDNAGYLHIHGINSSEEEIKKGIKLRSELTSLESQLQQEQEEQGKSIDILESKSFRLSEIDDLEDRYNYKVVKLDDAIKVIEEYTSSTNQPTEEEISAKLDSAKIPTSRERETAYDLIKWAVSKSQHKETLPTDQYGHPLTYANNKVDLPDQKQK